MTVFNYEDILCNCGGESATRNPGLFFIKVSPLLAQAAEGKITITEDAKNKIRAVLGA